MATSKTLAPTNVTISIPAMADQPDASVFSNCIDKEADAINTLNSQTAKKGYVQKLSDTEYTIPIATLQANHSYGMALVGAYTSLFALFFINNNTATITRLSGNLTASITNTTETEITLTFSNTVWDGITVMPL